jgi:glycosyltransferase involved in cell wall biosynthesis
MSNEEIGLSKSNSLDRLAIFVSDMDGGGAQRIMLNLAKGIVERGYPVDLVLGRADGAYLAEVPNSVRVVNLKASRILTSAPALIRYLRRERPRAMLSAMNHVNIVALWACRLAGVRTRVVVSEHSTLSWFAHYASSRRARMMPHLVKRFYPWADGIVAVSKGVADDLAKLTGLPCERIRVIYNPVVTSELRSKAESAFDHPWFAPGQPPVVLAAGRLTAQKDFPTLIRAFSRVYKTRPVRLLILGEGEERPTLLALAKENDLEHDMGLPGFVENPYAFMARAAVFALSSLWEALPTVLVEAMYCGAPVVATDCPSGPREILADGRYGRLVPVGDVDALASAIDTTLSSPRRKLPCEVLYPFELETAVNQYIELLFGSR